MFCCKKLLSGLHILFFEKCKIHTLKFTQPSRNQSVKLLSPYTCLKLKFLSVKYKKTFGRKNPPHYFFDDFLSPETFF